ncbi:MAG: complex I subunit 4 family protein [Opitutales bacterium]
MDLILPILILFPLLGALAVAAGPDGAARRIALVFSAGSLALAVLALLRFDVTVAGLQMVYRADWIPTLGAEWFFGADGLSLLLVLLTGLVTPFALWASPRNPDAPRLFYSLMLLLQSAVLGVFLTLNFVPWFLFWELSLIPAFILIKQWGGPKSGAAAYQFFLYTMTGSIAMLLAFLAIFAATGSFDFMVLAQLGQQGQLAEILATKATAPLALIFAGVFLGLAVKVPVVPFHTWLPDTYAEAPTSVSMLLTGLLSKMGLYGMLRLLLPMFPESIAHYGGLLLTLAMASILLSALSALAQTDLKRIFAYSSINHLGYCLLGIFAAGGALASEGLSPAGQGTLAGVYFQIFNHGLTAAALFAFVALIEQRSGGRRGLDDFGGLRAAAPVLCGLMGLVLFASIGLPGLSGFVGEFLIFKGSFSLIGGWVALALPGLLITAVFLLRVMHRVFSGPLAPKWQSFPDLRPAEIGILAPVAAALLLLGFFPGLLLRLFNSGLLLLP